VNSKLRLASNTIYNLINTVFAGVFGVATSIIIARTLGAAQLGEYSYILWLIGILTILINSGLPMAVTKYVSEYMGRDEPAAARKIFTSILKLELTISIIVSLSVLSLSFFFASEPERRHLLILASLNIIPIVLSRIYYSAAAGLQRYKILARASIITSPIQFLLIVLILFSGYSVIGLILVNIIGSILNLVILWNLIKKEFNNIPIQPSSLDESIKKRIAKYTAGVSGIILIDAIVWQKSEVFFLERFSTAENIAFYSLAFTIGYMAMQIPAVFSSLLIPYFSEIYGKTDTAGLKNGYVNSTRYLAFISFPIGIGGAVLSTPLIELAYGSEYLGSAIPAQIILLFNSFGAVSRASSSILYGTEEQSFILKWGGIIAIFNILLDLFLIPRYGAIGAAIANSTAQMGGVAGGALYINKEFGIRYPLKSVIKILASSLFMGIFTYTIYISFNGYTGMILSITLSPLIYIFSLLIIGAVEMEDRKLIYKLLERIRK
jgi:O-antigen/teichoic acid export membrane protein